MPPFQESFLLVVWSFGELVLVVITLLLFSYPGFDSLLVTSPCQVLPNKTHRKSNQQVMAPHGYKVNLFGFCSSS